MAGEMLDDDLRDMAEKQHGVVSRIQARAASPTVEALRHRLAGPDWELVTPRVLRLVGAPRTVLQDLMAAVLDAGPGSAASHRAAAPWPRPAGRTSSVSPTSRCGTARGSRSSSCAEQGVPLARPPGPAVVVNETARYVLSVAMRRALCLVFAVLVLGACSDDGAGDDPSATVPTAPTTTSTTASDPYAVPAVIDAAYLDLVLAALEQVDGDVARIVVQEGYLVPAAVDRIQAIYALDEANEQLRLWGHAIREGLDAVLKQPPGNRVTHVRRIVEVVEDKCVFAEVVRDYKAVARDPDPPRTSYIALSRLQPQADPMDLNPTPWVISFAGLNEDGSQPESPCNAS